METKSPRSLPNGPIDCEELLSRCMGRMELMERMLTSFRDNAESDVDALLDAIESGDKQELARIAHKLKGTSLTVSARSLADTADRLQEVAVRDAEDSLSDFACELKREYDSVSSHLTLLLSGGAF